MEANRLGASVRPFLTPLRLLSRILSLTMGIALDTLIILRAVCAQDSETRVMLRGFIHFCSRHVYCAAAQELYSGHRATSRGLARGGNDSRELIV